MCFMINRNCLNISVSTYLIQMHFPAALILIQKLPLSAMMIDKRAIAICGQMLPGFIEGCCTCTWKGGWHCRGCSTYCPRYGLLWFYGSPGNESLPKLIYALYCLKSQAFQMSCQGAQT